MKHNPKERILDNHATCCWNAWREHEKKCSYCVNHDSGCSTPRAGCTTGAATLDEYRIAESRLQDYIHGVQSA